MGKCKIQYLDWVAGLFFLSVFYFLNMGVIRDGSFLSFFYLPYHLSTFILISKKKTSHPELSNK